MPYWGFFLKFNFQELGFGVWTHLLLARVYNSPDRPVRLYVCESGALGSSILMRKLDVVRWEYEYLILLTKSDSGKVIKFLQPR